MLLPAASFAHAGSKAALTVPVASTTQAPPSVVATSEWPAGSVRGYAQLSSASRLSITESSWTPPRGHEGEGIPVRRLAKHPLGSRRSLHSFRASMRPPAGGDAANPQRVRPLPPLRSGSSSASTSSPAKVCVIETEQSRCGGASERRAE